MEKKRSFLGFLASLIIVFFTANAFAAGYTCDDLKKYTSCNAGYYLNGTGPGNSCSPCPAAYPNSDSGNSSGITACYSNTKKRAWTGSQVNGATPANCASVTEWNSCSVAACDYVAYANSAGTGDGTIKSGCSTNNASCTKTPKTVTANANYYVNGTTCSACSGIASGAYPKSDGGNISSAYCYKDGTKTGLQVNGSTPSGCASVTAWNACTPGTCTYKDYYTATDTTCTPTNCTKAPKTVTASSDYYVNGATCPACSGIASGAYPKSDGGNISSAYCYKNATKTGSQVNGPTPANCASVTAWNACTPGTCTYKDYYTATDTTCTASNCTKTPKTVTASANSYVDGTTCKTCSSYNATYPKSDGGSIGYAYCYKDATKTGSQVNGSTPSGCFSVTAWNSCTPGTCTYKDYLSATDTTCTASNCTKTAKTVTANSGNYVNGATCPVCNTNFPVSPQNNTYSENECYRNCTISDVSGSSNVTGTVTQGGTKTCKATACDSNHCLTATGGCIEKPANGSCTSDPNNPISCSAGYHLNDSKTDCIANTYTVSYSCGEGSGSAPTTNTATYNLSYTPKTNTCSAPVKTNQICTFTGWTVSGTSDVKTPGANFTWKYLENKTFTAKYVCNPTSCPDGQYLSSNACQTCPSGYTHSDANATSNTQCYKDCTQSCVSPACPANSSSCTFDTTVKWSGKQYYNTTSCVINPGQQSNCPIKTLACNRNYYTNGSVCSACSSLGDGTWTLSLSTNNSSPNGCYAACSIACEQQTCPAHATCTHGSEKSPGGKYYPSSTCTAPKLSCSIVVTPDPGYTDCDDGTCDPVVAPITLNRNYDNSDSTAVATIYQKYATGWYSNAAATTKLDKAPIPTRATYSFTGYYTARTGGTLVIKADGTLPANTTYKSATAVTLYAQWSLNNTSCQSGKYYDGSAHVECPAGKYCPGTGSTPIGTPGCASDCPADASGGTVSSDKGSSASTSCFTVRANQPLPDGTGRGNQTCFFDATKSTYINGCKINITACNAGYWREQESSTTCSSTDIGEYSPANDLAKHLCSDLPGAASNVTTASQNSGAATACYNPCSDIPIDNGIRKTVNTQEFYNGTQIPACSYTTQCNPGYKASGLICVPNVYTITLNHDNGTANSTIYLKYADGWYSNAAATSASKIATVAIPSKGDGKTFEGYTSASGDVVVGPDGKLTTNYTIFVANATITATYGNRQAQKCNAGTYYPGTGTSCTQCPAGNYCPGVDTFVGVGSPRGINTCASLGGTYTHAEGAAATVVTSDKGAAAATDCYATNVAYTSTSNTATGSKTCYFNQATTAYTDRCKDEHVLRCVGGYWLESSSDIDCKAVGTGYYSAKNATDRKACPNLGTTPGVKTFTETAETVQQCYLGNIWYRGEHSGHRRSCYHTADETDTNVSSGYSYNCNVSVIVTCDAGYYDDGKYTITNSKGEIERDCAKVTDKNSFSPDQSYFTDEPAQPDQELPGSSTKLHSCPETKSIANGTARRVFNAEWTASDYGVCEYKAATCDDGYRAITSGSVAKCVWDDPDACPEGFYCPDGSEEPLECPTDKNGVAGTTEIGAKAIDECFIKYDPYKAFQNGTGSAICNYSKDSKDYTYCHDITAKTCNAGYYYRDAGSVTCVGVVSGNYSPAGAITQTTCPAGGNGSNQFAANWDACYKNCEITVAHSETVAAKAEKVFGNSANTYAACQFHVTCKTGYSPKNNDTATPTCDANRYTITLDKNGGTGNVAASVECTFDSGACALPATTGLTRAGYSVGTKWCTASDGSGTCYNGGTTITTNISATGAATTLYAIWTPNVYEITLKHADATVAAEPVKAYLKYATGWFADNAALLPLAKLTKLPEKTGYEFSGYKAANNTTIVDTNGLFQTSQAALTFTTQPADVTVVWSAGNTHCDAGTYYKGTGAVCLPCTDDHYCPGGSFATDAGEAGINECRDGGKTAAGAKASSETQCFKENLSTYVATHGTGTQKCYFDTDKLAYSAKCTDKYITACDAGYWQENKAPGQESPDCVEVGKGYFSADKLIERTSCPNGGTTAETTAATVQRCYKAGLDYAAEFGTGTQRCYYSSGEGAAAIYNRDCIDLVITKCRGGYWLDTAITATDCSPVGLNFYSEDEDTERHACEGGGKTNSEITSSPLACYKDSETYTAEHGGGFRTCYYTSGTGDKALYETGCEIPTLTYCNGGYYAEVTINKMDCIAVGYGFWSPAPKLERNQCGAGETTATATSASADACYTCPPGQICDPDNGEEPKTCAAATGGTHPNSDAGNTDVAGCWRDCAMAPNAATMSGHDYYGKPDTCAIKYCKAGYTYNAATKTCDICPEGTFCGGGDDDCPAGQNCDKPKTCAELGDGSWPYSDTGATDASKCYRKCESYALEGGTAVPVNERAYYDTECIYKGFDNEGNPCDIEDGVCVTTACKPSYEMIGGKCVACNREHALSYKPTGNCMVESCEPGWHPYAQSCESDIAECPAPHALRAEKQWDYKKNSYGICIIKECEDGYHISSNACVADIQECTVEHGIGEKEWNHTTNTWGECVATSCDPGFTNDPYETNEPTKQCGHCKNKFGVKGELAASSYSRGCTISACMYQGEMYNLENNECTPICDVNGYEDETGTMKWNPVTHKCERKCKEGYVMW